MWNPKITKVHMLIPFTIGIYSFACLFLCNAFALEEVKSSSPKFIKKELNDILANVWQKSELDLENLRDYVFSETEIVQSLNNTAYRREYAWVVRDGFLLRSPILAKGKMISAVEQRAYEDKWIRARQNAGRLKNGFDFFIDCINEYLMPAPMPSTDSKSLDIFRTAVTRYMSDLMRIKPAKYDYSANVSFEGYKVIEIKYIPEEKGNIHNLVTLYILPEERRLIGMALHEKSSVQQLEYDFLMVMGKPIDETWLPKRFCFSGETRLGNSSYVKEFHSYSKSDVKAKFWFDEIK
jgi:hypothetical protein